MPTFQLPHGPMCCVANPPELRLLQQFQMVAIAPMEPQSNSRTRGEAGRSRSIPASGASHLSRSLQRDEAARCVAFRRDEVPGNGSRTWLRKDSLLAWPRDWTPRVKSSRISPEGGSGGWSATRTKRCCSAHSFGGGSHNRSKHPGSVHLSFLRLREVYRPWQALP